MATKGKKRQLTWGNGKVIGKSVIFDSNSDGGYNCVICEEKLLKRKDILKSHFKTVHPSEDLESFRYPRIKELCCYCQKPLDPHPNKMFRHVEQSCKVRPAYNHNNNNVRQSESYEQDVVIDIVEVVGGSIEDNESDKEEVERLDENSNCRLT